MNYYLDESGNSGDLINKKNDMMFSNQPIFVHSCIGIDDEKYKQLKSFITALKEKHNISNDTELKSENYYFKNPQLMREVIDYVANNKLPIVCEVMDKKYQIAVSMINHFIVPAISDASSPEALYIRNCLADFITENAPDECFVYFFDLCKSPSEDNLIKSINNLNSFFFENRSAINDKGYTNILINECFEHYKNNKRDYGEEQAIKWFVPIPDIDSYGNIVKLLPNVHSFYNQIARLNNIHNKKLSDVTLIHDTSNEFASPLRYCIDSIVEIDTENMPNIPSCDYDVIEKPKLIFRDSGDSIGIQVADLIAGFLSRYINGVLYKKIENMDFIYDEIFVKLIHYNRTPDPTGINFVLPLNRRNWLFARFFL